MSSSSSSESEKKHKKQKHSKKRRSSSTSSSEEHRKEHKKRQISSSSESEEETVKIRKIQDNSAPTTFNVKEWTKQKKESDSPKEKKPKKGGSLKLKGMVAKGHGTQTYFEKSTGSSNKASSSNYEQQLDARCKQKGDKYCS